MSVAKIEYEGQTFEVEITDQAKNDIRLKFNPSNLDKVSQLKITVAIWLSLVEKFAKENPEAGREFDMSRTLMQFASMGGVLAATKGL